MNFWTEVRMRNIPGNFHVVYTMNLQSHIPFWKFYRISGYNIRQISQSFFKYFHYKNIRLLLCRTHQKPIQNHRKKINLLNIKYLKNLARHRSFDSLMF